MINIELKVKLPWNSKEIDEVRSYEAGTTVEKVLKDLGLEAKDEGNFLIVVNGKVEYKDYTLQDGEQVSLLPALIGG